MDLIALQQIVQHLIEEGHWVETEIKVPVALRQGQYKR